MIDNTRTTCVRCGKGHYKAFDLNDDIFGDLRCDNCMHHVKFNQDLRKCLSPQAQAVMNAYKEARDGNYINGEWIQDEAGQVAAALRAAADQVAPESFTYYSGSFVDGAIEFEQGQECRNEVIRLNILAIATELEGAQ